MEQGLPLRDIHLPEAISWWPPAIGWWLAFAIAVLLFWLMWRLFKQWTRKTALKTAKTLLQQIKHNQQTSDLQKLRQISIWLRRVSISIAPRQQSAGLTGEKWLRYLDTNLDGSPFSNGVGQSLADVQFRKSIPDGLDIPAIIDLCELWLQRQKS